MNSNKVKFLLINPTSPLWRVKANQRPVNSGVFRFSMLPSLYVAASMPDYVETRIVDEDVESVDFNTDADLVGISFMTYNAPRAYEIADIFRRQGKTVIFGGYHPTFMPEEAIQHANSVCLGEAENNVPRMIEDYLAGDLKPFYESDLVNLDQLPLVDRTLLNNNAYVTLNAMHATRGCYHRCEFCSVAAFNRYTIRKRPVGSVLEELKGLGRYVLFMDDNIVLDKAYAKELFAAMIPYKKRWFSQCGMGIADDDELLDLAARSGCSGLFIGFESLSQEILYQWNKHCNRRKDYLEVVKKIHAKGIGIFAGFVFGGDDEGPDVFRSTLDFLLESNIEVLQSTRLTPFPGTPLFEKMKEEGRIFDYDWSHYDFFHVVFQPRNMSPEELNHGTAWLQRQFYSRKNIAYRISRAAKYLKTEQILRVVSPLNIGYRQKLKAYDSFELAKSFSAV